MTIDLDLVEAATRPAGRRWTASPVGDDGRGGPAPVFRATLALEDAPRRATLAVTYLGIGRFVINGREVGDTVLEPGWQDYSHRLVYREYDVGDLLRAGDNVLDAEVGDGWYAGRLGFFDQRGLYGTHRGVLAELSIVEADGSTRTMGTNGTWRWRPGPTRSTDLYDGETFDARPADGEWRPVEALALDLSILEPATAPPVRRIETLRPVAVLTTPSDRTVVDFGRNIVGWARIRVQGRAGDEVVLRFAEVLEHDELGTRPLRSARATDRYVLRGGAEEVWEPSFTYHGFRYVEVEGWPAGTDVAGGIEAVFVHSDMRRTGTFRTSHRGLAQLHENVVASMRGNFVSIPTDCPQRDERLGWTGDIAVFGPTAMFLYDASTVLRSWLRDVALEQRPDGRIPIFVPEVPFPPEAASNPQFDGVRAAVWGDVATMLPTAIFTATGDRTVLAENLPVMRRWVDGIVDAVGPSLVWNRGYQFGDWLDPAAPPDSPQDALTEAPLVATAYFAHSARLVAVAAAELGHDDLAERYSVLGDEVAAAFRRAFVLPDGRLTSDAQTAYAVALCLDLLDGEESKRRAGDRLVALVRQNGHRIGTGFVGTPLILDALTRAGALDDAYALLLQEQVPSWLYAVTMGATTVWERWDSMLPDGSINPGEMTSFNHYALGAVADWLHRMVAGLAPAAPGYRRIRVAPRPGPVLQDAGATLETPHGTASVDWRIDGDDLRVEIVVPEGTTAVVDLEGLAPQERGPGRHVVVAPGYRRLSR